MKIKQLKTQEAKKTTTKNKNHPDVNSSKSKNLPTGPEKILDAEELANKLAGDFANSIYDPLSDNIGNVKKASEAFHDVLDAIENAQIVEKSPAEKMEEILKNNDKFETIKVIMELLCKELELPISASMESIVMGLQRVTENYFKSMDEWKKLTKKPVNNDIRQ